jgi:hypothetical protein
MEIVILLHYCLLNNIKCIKLFVKMTNLRYLPQFSARSSCKKFANLASRALYSKYKKRVLQNRSYLLLKIILYNTWTLQLFTINRAN